MFLAKDASHYVGPVGYPDGNAALMYVLEFLYNHLCLEDTVSDAHRETSAHEDDRNQFVLYSRSSEGEARARTVVS